MLMSRVGVVVIGGGPAGISAAIAAAVDGASVLIVDREARLGGALKQAIHDGFGFLRYDERLTGPEYAFRDISTLEQTNAFVMLQTTVTKIVSIGNAFQLTLCNRHGIVQLEAKSVVLATGCLERTARQIHIHGSRPAGVFTAGSAQYYLNIMGQVPARRCIILGSGDLGLVMAKTLTTEGINVLGIYEPNGAIAGSQQNLAACMNDYNIPLHFNHTITHVFGTQRLKSAIISRVDKGLVPIAGSENRVKCDSVIISTGLIPETDLAESMGIPVSSETNGPECDQNFMTLLDGLFCCGNSVHINGKAEYISESGAIAGRNAARFIERDRQLVKLSTSKDFLYCVPQYLDIDMLHNTTTIFFRPREIRKDAKVKIYIDGHELLSQDFLTLRPPEVEKIEVDFNTPLTTSSKIELRMER